MRTTVRTTMRGEWVSLLNGSGRATSSRPPVSSIALYRGCLVQGIVMAGWVFFEHRGIEPRLGRRLHDCFLIVGIPMMR